VCWFVGRCTVSQVVIDHVHKYYLSKIHLCSSFHYLTVQLVYTDVWIKKAKDGHLFVVVTTEVRAKHANFFQCPISKKAKLYN